MELDYNLSDIVVYKGELYEITEIHTINWFSALDPLLYGLLKKGKEENLKKPADIYCLADTFRLATPEEIKVWSVLYDKTAND